MNPDATPEALVPEFALDALWAKYRRARDEYVAEYHEPVASADWVALADDPRTIAFNNAVDALRTFYDELDPRAATAFDEFILTDQAIALNDIPENWRRRLRALIELENAAAGPAAARVAEAQAALARANDEFMEVDKLRHQLPDEAAVLAIAVRTTAAAIYALRLREQAAMATVADADDRYRERHGVVRAPNAFVRTGPPPTSSH